MQLKSLLKLNFLMLFALAFSHSSIASDQSPETLISSDDNVKSAATTDSIKSTATTMNLCFVGKGHTKPICTP